MNNNAHTNSVRKINTFLKNNNTIMNSSGNFHTNIIGTEATSFNGAGKKPEGLRHTQKSSNRNSFNGVGEIRFMFRFYDTCIKLFNWSVRC